LDRVVGVEGIRDPMLAVVVCTPTYLGFISYAVTPTSFCTIGLDRGRLSSCIASWIRGGVPLDVGSVGCIVGGIASGISRGVCWSISRWVVWSIGCSVGSGISRLHYFVFASSFFSHRVEGTLATTSLARMLRSASRNLPQIYCIEGLFPRPEQLQHRHWLVGAGSLENLQGGLGQREQLPNWSAASCKRQVRRAQVPEEISRT
jgi:hypothetical protein